MNIYLDTSALVPLIVEEPGTAACRELWERADLAVSSAVTWVEATAALARAARHGRLTAEQLATALQSLDAVWARVAVVPADEQRLDAAAQAARRHALRGYDAVHCACAVSVSGDDVLAASGDQELLTAWRAEGLAVVDTTR
ncbi:type II toxin-antitoxin system VapC family toxin [Klenkia sp. LSe6-5]|uniref:Ribonuclease VapC n=1 Tax=Klenkia sesuvii TaxID=3103137 RepID=A0ABU8DZE1_9ACTN